MLHLPAAGTPHPRAFPVDRLVLRSAGVLHLRAAGATHSKPFAADLVQAHRGGKLQPGAAGASCPRTFAACVLEARNIGVLPTGAAVKDCSNRASTLSSRRACHRQSARRGALRQQKGQTSGGPGRRNRQARALLHLGCGTPQGHSEQTEPHGPAQGPATAAQQPMSICPCWSCNLPSLRFPGGVLLRSRLLPSAASRGGFCGAVSKAPAGVPGAGLPGGLFLAALRLRPPPAP